MNAGVNRNPSSYRDPDGFIFERDGIIYRHINFSYEGQYEHLMSSGLYAELINKKLLVSHQECSWKIDTDTYKIIQPERIPFISYPYEWCHDQLKKAAELTIEILQTAITYGMTLKDASPFNIQFKGTQAIFIDTLSFTWLDSEQPWVAYRQFCECFLAPLALSRYCGQPIHRTLIAWPEGIPLHIASKSLPLRSKLNITLSLHLHLQSNFSNESAPRAETKKRFSIDKLKTLIRSLSESVDQCRASPEKSNWTEYYQSATTRDQYLPEKDIIIRKWVADLEKPYSALDIGCNTGRFSEKLSETCGYVVALDNDHSSINHFYKRLKEESTHSNILPLVQDLTNPSPARGVLETERSSLMARGPFDIVIALAVMHHLILRYNLTLQQIAETMARLTERILIIEFVPEDDPYSIEITHANKQNSRPYDLNSFLLSFKNYFSMQQEEKIGSTSRILFQLKKL